MASIDLDKMLVKIKSSQWALADIDWDAPGADLITDEQWPKLKAFMADLMWIEHVGARAFAAMAKKAPTETLREIYTYFHAEEQRHANAEMALMKRWGMLDGDEIPEPNINLRLVIEWLDRYADEMPVYVLGTVVPMLEVALDGALCSFLLETVDDPVCHAAFQKINDDESRHLGVGFTVMEMQGRSKTFIQLTQMVAPLLDPRLILGIASYFPLLNKMRDNIMEMGLPEEKLYNAMRKFEKIGGRTADGRRNPWFQIISRHGRFVINRNNRFYHAPVDALVKVTQYIPRRALPAVPSWVKELTYRPAA
ncbi:ferritin-like domain-containing protein [Alcanivorax quisquiliarum]|uniref:Ferritin-like domain-containing protein n=1 Tax=Alcanivorax quisquiliarum TaxID=2933565 RepID=A0ABT0E4M4_9GAMM|nr:ferritin-like domain-containing protein [Alcanivorax quisquiliarum]MCK0536754.1 ferritin-like domain-containing protein [Alcanivorax quisquiliarum]